MDLETQMLMEIQKEINYLIIKNDLTHLPEVVRQLNRYCILNQIDLNISSKDIINLRKMCK